MGERKLAQDGTFTKLEVPARVPSVFHNRAPPLPLSALAQKDGRKVVWTVDRGTATVHSRGIEVADFTGDGVRVTKGLDNGDLVVAAGTQFMSENLKVKLPDQQSAAADTDATVR